VPILRSLGWDEGDPTQVMPEYSTARGRVDFALSADGRRPAVFVEVKGVGKSATGDRQLFEYAFHEGVPICLLTDGREWSFYLPSGQGTYEDRRFYLLRLDERPPSDSANTLRRYLARDEIRSGNAFQNASKDYQNAASMREANRTLPAAWSSLVRSPEDLLVELLCQEVETICGVKPDAAKALEFLRSLAPSSNAHQRPPQTPSESPQERALGPNRRNETPTGRLVTYSILTETRTMPTANAALIDILTTLARRDPTKIPTLAAAVQTGRRNHIARSVEEVYPERPDLARAEEFSPGWFVGLNIANREKMRILRAACSAFGLRFGKDLDISLPNAQ
jgi:hypothetical protein